MSKKKKVALYVAYCGMGYSVSGTHAYDQDTTSMMCIRCCGPGP